MEKPKITFSRLSLPLKIIVILAWIGAAFDLIGFMIGFIEGLYIYS